MCVCCVHDVCALLAAVLVIADVCIYMIWDVVVAAALCLHAVSRPSVLCSWSAVGVSLHCIQVCSSFYALFLSRVFL